jgi:hypothetical protein
MVEACLRSEKELLDVDNSQLTSECHMHDVAVEWSSCDGIPR